MPGQVSRPWNFHFIGHVAVRPFFREPQRQGSVAAGAVSILAGLAITGAVISTLVAPAATLASAAAAVGGATSSGGATATVTTAATAGVAAGAATTTASTGPASTGGAGALVTILSVSYYLCRSVC